MISSINGSNSGPHVTNSTDIVANKISLIQQAINLDITQLFSTNTNVSNLISSITRASMGLGNVANTAPSYLPISNGTQQALKTITKASMGLGNVANTGPSCFATASSVSAITATSSGLGNAANLAPSDLPVSNGYSNSYQQHYQIFNRFRQCI